MGEIVRSEKICLKNPYGLHMRPAAVLAAAVAPFESTVTLDAFGHSIDAKSQIAIMAACLGCGDVIEIRAEGSDEEEALACALDTIRYRLES